MKTAPKRLLPLLSVIFALALAEGVLRLAGSFGLLPPLDLFRKHTEEHAAAWRWLSEDAPDDFPHYDPLLGWRNYDTTDNPPGVRETLGPDRWRFTGVLPNEKSRPRIAIVGDSFSFGWKVDDSQTIASYLSSRLGPDVEVLNFGVRGYGLDQMALVAAHVAAEYRPDHLVYAFIRWDLDRSCGPFEFGAAKPHFELSGDELVLRGVPVPTVAALKKKHAAHRWRDRALLLARGSRLVSLVGQIALQGHYRRCTGEIAPRILDWVVRHAPAGARLHFVHLDGKLPEAFSEKFAALPGFVDLASRIGELGARLDLPADRHPDGHPKASLNRIYAEGLYEVLASELVADNRSSVSRSRR